MTESHINVSFVQLGTVISAYGCWVYTKGHPSANGVRYEILKRYMEENIITNGMTYREKETKGNIKLQSHYVEEEIQQRAGFWGYLMQTVYQVIHQDTSLQTNNLLANFNLSLLNG